MTQSKLYSFKLSKSRINLTKKEKLFLDLNGIKRINTLRFRLLTQKEYQGLVSNYGRFLSFYQGSSSLDFLFPVLKLKPEFKRLNYEIALEDLKTKRDSLWPYSPVLRLSCKQVEDIKGYKIIA